MCRYNWHSAGFLANNTTGRQSVPAMGYVGTWIPRGKGRYFLGGHLPVYYGVYRELWKSHESVGPAMGYDHARNVPSRLMATRLPTCTYLYFPAQRCESLEINVLVPVSVFGIDATARALVENFFCYALLWSRRFGLD